MVELDQDHLSMVKNALTGVVNEREGTAYKERIVGIDMGGQDWHGAGQSRDAARRGSRQSLVFQPRSRLVRRVRASKISRNRDRGHHRTRRRRR